MQWLCPVCGKELIWEPQGVTCCARHHFDRAAAGYVNLQISGHKHAKNPGDNKAMIQARHRFLSGGFYHTFCESGCEMGKRYVTGKGSVQILDVGCGEGYYTENVKNTLQKTGGTVDIAGIDLSKEALRYAAKRIHDGEFAVASCYHLPLQANCVDLVINYFSPLCIPELYRVLKPDGIFLYAVPDARHLWHMKEILYETPYENPTEEKQYAGFALQEVCRVTDHIRLCTQRDIADLFAMTPYCYRSPQEGVKRLLAFETLETEVAFRIYAYRKVSSHSYNL